MSPQGGWCDSEAGRAGAGVKALLPDRDSEIFGAECKRTDEMNGVSAAELMIYCKRTGHRRPAGSRWSGD
jgi:hypothetical protein